MSIAGIHTEFLVCGAETPTKPLLDPQDVPWAHCRSTVLNFLGLGSVRYILVSALLKRSVRDTTYSTTFGSSTPAIPRFAENAERERNERT